MLQYFSYCIDLENLEETLVLFESCLISVGQSRVNKMCRKQSSLLSIQIEHGPKALRNRILEHD